ncbi:MAG TPA: hypothetical protein VGM63_18635 [Mucilaginibacter sp.]
MATLKLQSIESAPEVSKYSLEAVKRRFGLVPNINDTLENSSILLNGYMTLNYQFKRSSLSAGDDMKTMANNLDLIFSIPISKHYSNEYLQAIREDTNKK